MATPAAPVFELPLTPPTADRNKPADAETAPAYASAAAPIEAVAVTCVSASTTRPKLATLCPHSDRQVRARGRCGSCYNALTNRERRQRLEARETKRRQLGAFWEHKILSIRERDDRLIDDLVQDALMDQQADGFEAVGMATFGSEVLVLFRRRELPPESGRDEGQERQAAVKDVPKGVTLSQDVTLSPARA